MGLSSLFSDAVELVKAASIPPELAGHVDISGTQLWLSHEFVRRALVWATQNGKDFTLDELAWTSDGYRARIAIGVTVVATTLMPQRAAWKQGEFAVDIATPDGVAIEGRPILNFFLAAVGMMVGGTRLGEAILSSSLPPQIRWNGEVAVCTVATQKIALPSWLAEAATVTATFTPDPSGIWVRPDQVAHLVSLVPSLVGLFGREK